MITNAKRLHGQFFTTKNPFVNEGFLRWFKSIPNYRSEIILEPFAGANNIVVMLQDLGFDNVWECYDIQPVNNENNASRFKVKKNDSLNHFPKGYKVAITNPPYLAKNSATARGLRYHGKSHDDVYKACLDVMLKNCEYVAAIIPESFITQGIFHERLTSVVSLTCRMFEDTETPVCLALFSPADQKKSSCDFELWSENRNIGNYSTLSEYISPGSIFKCKWKFNQPKGQIGLYAVDNNQSASIKFVDGNDIASDIVSGSSRSITRISIENVPDEFIQSVIQEAQKILNERRLRTHDVFMTAFKGLRADGKYRRRLDYKQAREILDLAAEVVRAGGIK